MADQTFNQCRILVVEDEYLLADELATELADEGATVLGPAPTVERAMALLEAPPLPHGAILDLNLGGEPAFPVADALIELGVPLIFTTGYDSAAIPERFASVPTCEKPISIARVTAALSGAIHARSA